MPTLHTLQTKLKGMLQKQLKYSEPLVTALLEGMENRFTKELPLSFAVTDKIVAAVVACCARFQVKMVPRRQKAFH